MDYKAAVFIGRFQPVHQSHLEAMRQGLGIAEKLIIIIGSCKSAPNIKNPFTFEQRERLIRASLSPVENARTIITGVRDYYYNDMTWVADVQQKVRNVVSDTDTVAIIGNYKDSSSYYLKYFPQWEFNPVKTNKNMDATYIREALLTLPYTEAWSDKGTIAEIDETDMYNFLQNMDNYLSEPVINFFQDYIKSPEFISRQKEFKFIAKYKEQWKDAPYTPTFVTVDAVVVCNGHILVVKRKFDPGKGLLALPGGFVRGGERLQFAAIRELKEETGIKVDKMILDSSIAESHVFDHPSRSLRGRTITHAYYLKLKSNDLPEIKAADDAEQVMWLPLMDVGAREQEFYEDHAHIISYFINRG